MTEGMEMEVPSNEEISDGNEYLEEDASLSDEGQDMPETAEDDEGETESGTADTGYDDTADADAGSSEAENGLPEAGTDADGTDVPVEGLNVTGNILILPEGYELNFEESSSDGNIGTEMEAAEGSALSSEQFGQISEQLEQVVETVSAQNDVLYGGTAVTCLMLGAVFGILLIHGFRLRRV